MMPQDAKQYAPATQRNREPILAVLQQYLPPTGVILEIASGTGEHAVFFASQLTPRCWLPSDIGEIQLNSITAWCQEHSVPNLLPPIRLDVLAPDWPQRVIPLPANASAEPLTISAIVNINMIHISSWAATEGLMAGAEQVLGQGGILYLYGPYQIEGKHTAPSNKAFDEMLRSQNPDWGVRHLEEVIDLAKKHHLHWIATIPMPANNFSVIFQREDV
jgi:hypothetical protein